MKSNWAALSGCSPPTMYGLSLRHSSSGSSCLLLYIPVSILSVCPTFLLFSNYLVVVVDILTIYHSWVFPNIRVRMRRTGGLCQQTNKWSATFLGLLFVCIFLFSSLNRLLHHPMSLSLSLSLSPSWAELLIFCLFFLFFLITFNLSISDLFFICLFLSLSPCPSLCIYFPVSF